MSCYKKLLYLHLSMVFIVAGNLLAMNQPQKVILPYENLEKFEDHIKKTIQKVEQLRAIEQQNLKISLNIIHKTLNPNNLKMIQDNQFNFLCSLQLAHAIKQANPQN